MIRFAKKSDIPAIMNFVDKFWKKDHILARDKNFFSYQYELDDQVCFVLALDDETEEINGVLGFIPYGKGDVRDVMDALWKVVHTDDPMLGVNLLKFLVDHIGARVVASPGINKKTFPIYKWLGFHVGEYVQWYRLGTRGINTGDYRVAIVQNTFKPCVQAEQWSWIEYQTFEELQNSFNFAGYTPDNSKPYKESWYLNHRYFNHPCYYYRVFGVKEPKGEINLLLVFRIQTYAGSCALRLVDCIGNTHELLHASKLIDYLASSCDAEYVDFYEVGLPDELLEQAGWLKVETSGNIIPNYFEPYVPENIKIFYFSTDPDVVLFKADGDQDRPS